MPRYMYHWTPAVNLASIAQTGLDPAYATGKRATVWMADETRALWAVAHAAMHQRCGPDEMVCVRVRVDGLRLTRTGWTGVMTSDKLIAPSRLSVVSVAFGRRGKSLRSVVSGQ